MLLARAAVLVEDLTIFRGHGGLEPWVVEGVGVRLGGGRRAELVGREAFSSSGEALKSLLPIAAMRQGGLLALQPASCVIDRSGGCMWTGMGWTEDVVGGLISAQVGEAGFHCCGDLNEEKAAQ